MTTLDKDTRPATSGPVAPSAPPHDPATPFYAVGGADPDFALPPRGESGTTGFWARLLSPARRK